MEEYLLIITKILLKATENNIILNIFSLYNNYI